MVEAAGLIKIGRTMGGFSGLDLAKRLIDLQHMSPVRIALVAIGRGVRSERLLHTEFMDSRRHGEWFTASAVRRWISLHHGNSCLTCTLLGSGHDA
jgi:hypothetical protein